LIIIIDYNKLILTTIMSLIIDKKYKIVSRLGNGGFGMIFKGINLNTNEEIAIKIEKKTEVSTLKNEAKIYNYLNKISGVPKLRTYGSEGAYNYIVIDLLGESLEKIKNNCSGSFSINMVLLVGIQMVQRIQEIHLKGIIHRDIKPDNFLINKNTNKLYLIDFGLAKRYLDNNNNHIKLSINKGLVGTINYISINVHNGIVPSRRDDLESVFYVLLYLIIGELPWRKEKNNHDDVVREKINLIKNKTIIENIPNELIHFYLYCRNLEYEQSPDYDFLKRIFFDLYSNNKTL
jgi:serine/threonine protein kinase